MIATTNNDTNKDTASTHNDNFIYMVDRLHEMLFDYTIDIFRAPLLNTRLLLLEYLELEREIRHGKIPEKRLQPVCEELIEAYKTDTVIAQILPKEERSLILSKLSSCSKDTLEAARYLRDRVMQHDYFSTLIAQLKKTILLPREKKKLESLLRTLVSELYSRGYSHEYMYFVIQRIGNSLSEDETIEQSLDRFLEYFNFEDKDYLVFFAFDTTYPDDRKVLSEIKTLVANLSLITFDEDNQFSKQKNMLCRKNGGRASKANLQICSIEVTAKDANRAAHEARMLFDFCTCSMLLLLNESSPTCIPYCLVQDKNNPKAEYHAYQSQSYKIIKPKPTDRKKLIKRSHQFLGILVSKIERLEFNRLAKAIELHNSSLAINNYQNSFISLWTALEVLCDGGKTVNQSLREVLELTYLSRVIKDLNRVLNSLCPKIKQASMQTSGINDESKWLYSLVFLSTWKSERELILSELAEKPLERRRIFELNELTKGSNLVKHISRYGQRVSWHIDRMYRTRNSIVHAGDTPLYLDSLGEHLHAYLDVLFENVLDHIESGDFRYAEDILVAIRYEHQVYMRKLQNLDLSNQADLEWVIAYQSSYHESRHSI